MSEEPEFIYNVKFHETAADIYRSYLIYEGMDIPEDTPLEEVFIETVYDSEGEEVLESIPVSEAVEGIDQEGYFLYPDLEENLIHFWAAPGTSLVVPELGARFAMALTEMYFDSSESEEMNLIEIVGVVSRSAMATVMDMFPCTSHEPEEAD